ncbi:caveolin-1-like [Clavelina lepadiformis]|uniref:Caveolin n=1 Tax=Clavelina lepadiformis TaxID=159417 RepID=A0ABP0GJT7_CLALP
MSKSLEKEKKMSQVTDIGSTHEFDLDNRDPTLKNEHVRVWFEDSFAEPDGTHSIDGVWTCSYKTFECSKKCCYIVLSILCGGPCALLWGLMFAMQSCYHIWCIGPYMKSFFIDLGCCAAYWKALVQCYCDPLYESVGKIFGNIRFNHRYEVV